MESLKEPTPRSTSFSQSAPTERSAPTRNDDLTVKEDLPTGPIDHPAPFDDPRWERMEPYSGMHLTYVPLALCPNCILTRSVKCGQISSATI
jgi:hypothetical protein